MNEPQPAVRAPPCPRHLKGAARAEWRRVCRKLVAQGILTDLDRGVLVAYCESWGLYVEAKAAVAKLGAVLTSEKGGMYANPYMNQMTAALKALTRYAAELGMTPSSRSRVSAVPVPKDKSKDKTRMFRIVG